MAFLWLAHKALWCSVYWSWSVSVFVCQRVCVFACSCVRTCECWGHTFAHPLPLVIHPGHTVWNPTAIIGRTERETALIRTLHLVGLQHPNCKIVPCIERIILNYSELKFKFHFVLALSNGQTCLDEISKGQGELKCLLYGLSGRERAWARWRSKARGKGHLPDSLVLVVERIKWSFCSLIPYGISLKGPNFSTPSYLSYSHSDLGSI